MYKSLNKTADVFDTKAYITLYPPISRLKQQLSKIHNSSLTTTHSSRNLGFIFDEYLTFSDKISALSKSCYYHIRELRCIRHRRWKELKVCGTDTRYPALPSPPLPSPPSPCLPLSLPSHIPSY